MTARTAARSAWCLLSFALGLLAGCGPGSSRTEDQGGALSMALPSRIQAEDFKSGGEGVGYHDTTTRNLGAAYRASGVDLEPCTDIGGGYDVGWTAAGEWLSYDVQVQQSGTFEFVARVASAVAGTKSLHLQLDGTDLPSVSFTSSSGWQAWLSLPAGIVSLAQGTHTLRVVMDTAGLNLNYLDVTEQSQPKPRPTSLRWGVSAVHPKSGQTWAQAYAEQVTELGASAVFYYFPGGVNPTWNANLASIPSGHDIMISTKVSDVQAIQAFVNQVPRDRQGLIYLHYWQEPENDFVTAAASATFRARASAMAPIVKSHPRMRFGVELMAWSLQPGSGRNWKDWVTPEMDYVGWSIYANSSGIASKGGDGKAEVDRVADAMAQDGRPWGAFAWGFALNTSLSYSVPDRQIRAQWLLDSAAELKARGAMNGLWFNTPWGATDYSLQTDSILLQAWQTATAK